MARCPHCGKVINVAITAAPSMAKNGYTINGKQTFHNSAFADVGGSALDFAGYNYEKRTPAREPNLQADVAVPAAQSLLTGLAIGIPSAAGSGLFGFTAGEAVTIGAMAGTVVTTGTWLFKLGLHNQLLWLVETVTGRDVDGDGKAGQPAPKPEKPSMKLEVLEPSEDGANWKMFNLPVSEIKFKEFCRGVTTIKTLAESQWIGGGGVFSKSEYGALLSALSEAGFVKWVDDSAPNKGRKLTGKGRASLIGYIR